MGFNEKSISHLEYCKWILEMDTSSKWKLDNNMQFNE
jgi:hypothetical protein